MSKTECLGGFGTAHSGCKMSEHVRDGLTPKDTISEKECTTRLNPLATVLQFITQYLLSDKLVDVGWDTT